MEGLGEGRIVHYILSDGSHRQAIIVSVIDREKGMVNLSVFLDGDDEDYSGTQTMIWKPSIMPDFKGKSKNTWHWPERV